MQAKQALDDFFSPISDEELVAEAIHQGELEDPLMKWEITSELEYFFILNAGNTPITPAVCFQVKNLYNIRRSVEVKITPELLKRINKK